ncbi:MAG: NADH-quinone oxidoreductase subunit K [Terracidiphilus sp.]
MTTPLAGYLLVAALLFAIGLGGALVRRNAILVLIGIELMLNAANLNLIAFWRSRPASRGAHWNDVRNFFDRRSRGRGCGRDWA